MLECSPYCCWGELFCHLIDFPPSCSLTCCISPLHSALLTCKSLDLARADPIKLLVILPTCTVESHLISFHMLLTLVPAVPATPCGVLRDCVPQKWTCFSKTWTCVSSLVARNLPLAWKTPQLLCAWCYRFFLWALSCWDTFAFCLCAGVIMECLVALGPSEEINLIMRIYQKLRWNRKL